MNRTLTDIPSSKEIEEACFGMGSWKSPGPDGFEGGFYQDNWEVVHKEVIEVVRSFFENENLLKSFNHTTIALIPKVPHPETPSQFRTISLCNLKYKIISKLLANRLKTILPLLITESQLAFVPRRAIQDNVLIAHALIHHISKSRRVEEKWLAMKLYLNKAYDSVSWEFLVATMRKMGFDDTWCRWIWECISTSAKDKTNAAVVWKGIVKKRSILEADSRWLIDRGLKDQYSQSKALVQEFINHHSRSWRIEALRNVLTTEDLRSVLQVSIPMHTSEDTRVWMWSKDGEYVVKSGYTTTLRLNEENKRLRNEELYTIDSVSGWFKGMVGAIKEKLLPRDTQDRIIFTATIWTSRNNFVFQGSPINPEATLSKAINWRREMIKVQERKEASCSVQIKKLPNHISQNWRPPENGTIKLNCDTNWNEGSKCMTSGWILRNSESTMISGDICRSLASNPTQAEAIGLRDALIKVQNRLEPLLVDMDNQLVVRLVNGKSKGGIFLTFILEDIYVGF